MKALRVLLVALSFCLGSVHAATVTGLVNAATNGSTAFQRLLGTTSTSFNYEGQEWAVNSLTFQTKMRSHYSAYLNKKDSCTWIDASLTGCTSKVKVGPTYWVDDDYCAGVYEGTYYGQPIYYAYFTTARGARGDSKDRAEDAYSFNVMNGFQPYSGPLWKTRAPNAGCHPQDAKFPTYIEFNNALVGVLQTTLDDARPNVAQLVSDWGFSPAGPFLEGGYGTPFVPDPADPTDPTDPTGPAAPDPYAPGSGSACGLTGLSVFEAGIARMFKPCTDWPAQFLALRTTASERAPFGFVALNPIKDVENMNWSGACAALTFGAPGGANIEGVGIPAIDVCNSPVGEKIHSVLRPILLLLFAGMMIANVLKAGRE